MHPAIVRHWLLPLHEWVRGRSTLRELDELERTQWLGAEALRAIQVGKLRALLRHAAAQSRFYAQRLAEARVEPGGISDLAELERLPTPKCATPTILNSPM